MVGPKVAFHAKNTAEILGADFIDNPQGEYDLLFQMGCYAETAEGLEQLVLRGEANYKKTALMFCGSDIISCRTYWGPKLERTLKTNWDVFLVETEAAQEEVKHYFGLEVLVLPLVPRHLFLPQPLPNGQFRIGIYMPLQRAAFFRLKDCKDAQGLCPDFHFIYYGFENQGYPERQDPYAFVPSCHAALRLTLHDTWPFTLMEYMMAGRRVVTNCDMPFGYGARNGAEAAEALHWIAETFTKPDYEASAFWRDYCDHEKFRQRVYALCR